MDAQKFPQALHDAVAKVCPIDGVSIGNPEDRKTWTFHAAEGATQEQKDAAKQVIETFTGA